MNRFVWPLIRGEPSFIIGWYGALIFIGMVLAVISAQFRIPGIISAVYLVYLGACGGCFVSWRTERGLWMLAGLVLFTSCVIYGHIITGQVCDEFRQVGPPSLGVLIDASIATLFLTATIRFLVTVIRHNRTLSHPPDDL